MLVTTTNVIEGGHITHYYGIVSGETFIGSFGYNLEKCREAKNTALREMENQAKALGANAVIGVSLDYEMVGEYGTVLMVTACGTAVTVE
ncbi:YbjQ family protein [Bacteroides sp. UBA939]|uniref:YbjQ family protein n=1 Tax=Bacteroides sp. UBA939 TaxID=1946092 RepID=UPI0025C65FC1|nr:YbjQ family protein [Bacteroides sp. UBA939]